MRKFIKSIDLFAGIGGMRLALDIACKNNQKINFFSLGSKRNWSDTLDKRITKKIEKNFYKEMKELDYI